jgi:hypothetical protein
VEGGGAGLSLDGVHEEESNRKWAGRRSSMADMATKRFSKFFTTSNGLSTLSNGGCTPQSRGPYSLNK